MFYLKNASPIISYIDPITRQTIGRGQIVAFKDITVKMRARIRKRGIIEVTEQEYNVYMESLKPVDPLPKVEDQLAESSEEVSVSETEVNSETDNAEPEEKPKYFGRGRKKQK